jgi:geranyl-CoA carboxylase alpha subunit
MQFTKVLIANRGEIAVRIARTARAMGYRTVAVFSDADAGALHVRLCDEAVRIGPAPVHESYLSIPAILRAAELARADAVHPGYGFLSENAEFAAACGAAGLVFIGPSPSAIAAMGNKAAAKRRMLAAGVPCIPGYHGPDQSDRTLTSEADRIGYPIMIKAAAGGGGRGMRRVEHPDDFAAAASSARSESLNAFGSAELILERAIVDGRHVEIQVFADTHGNVIHLGERDCSIQRRHQKVIEEAPSPVMTRELRVRMGEAAVTAAYEIGYSGAGTVEFLLDAGGAFYFLEMNTRLQVEHPVTEAITGLDLVAWQLRVAQGELLALTQAQVRLDGHAIEARLYAEAPQRGFLPQSGTVHLWQPASGLGVRIDHGLEAPCAVSPDYDPMLAKVIARGATREEARRRLLMALEDTVLLGLETNRSFLIDMLNHPEFVAGGATTAFIDRHFHQDSAAVAPLLDRERILSLAAALLHVPRQSHSADQQQSSDLATRAWRSTADTLVPMRLQLNEETYDLDVVSRRDGAIGIAFKDSAVTARHYEARLYEQTEDRVRFEIDGLRQTARFVRKGLELHLHLGTTTAIVRDTTLLRGNGSTSDGDLRLLAPMDGRIVAVLAQTGQAVVKGQCIAILEAMKMQHELTAQRDGTVAEVAVREGDQVAARQLVAAMTRD